MYYYPTQEDMRIVKQQSKNVFLKIELLNKNFKIIDSIYGNLISDSLTVDSEAKQRRAYSCVLHVTDSSFFIGDDKKIWIDKYIRVYYGITPVRHAEPKWWLIGTFTYIDVNYSYSETENQISITCGDLMADYDGTKNGQMAGYSLKIPAGEDIRKSILAILKDAKITNYYVEDIHKEIPYDLEFNDTKTYCDILTKICDLYDSWEFYFDIDGTFIWRQIPTGLSEPVSYDDTLIDQIWINESTNYSFSGIYNVTEVWGKMLELTNEDRYADTSTFSGGVYSITLEGVTSLDKIDHLDKIGIKICANNSGGDTVKINDLSPIPILNEDGTPIKKDRLQADKVYVFSYRRNVNQTITNALFLYGQSQTYGIYKETNKSCPFSTTNLGYEIINRVTYEDLYSDDLCYNQAEYLTYKSTAMMDTITLTLLIVPWIDVNQKIKYTLKNSGKTEQYIIKSFNWSTLDGTMQLVLYRFLEDFSYVKNKDKIQKERKI